MAVAGNNDSQDSQAILEAYRAEFGAETVRSQCGRLRDTGELSGMLN